MALALNYFAFRFQCFGVCQKIESNVAYPLSGLNVSDFAKNIDASGCTYDLYGVVVRFFVTIFL